MLPGVPPFEPAPVGVLEASSAALLAFKAAIRSAIVIFPVLAGSEEENPAADVANSGVDGVERGGGGGGPAGDAAFRRAAIRSARDGV